MAQGRRGVFAPSLVVSYSHSDDDIDRTVEAIDSALGVYRRALEAGPTGGSAGAAGIFAARNADLSVSN